jgi:hypothetical protein
VKRFVVVVCVLVLAGLAGATAYAWHEMASTPLPPRDAATAVGHGSPPSD